MSEPSNPPKPSEPLKEGGLKTPPQPEPPQAATPTAPDGEPGDRQPDRQGGMIGEG